jgi:MFS family permease
MLRLGILATVFLSGASLMSLEMASFNQFPPFFGSTIDIWGGLISVFLGGLALGAVVGGRWADRNPTLWKLGLILAVAGVLTLAMPCYARHVLDWASGKGAPLPADWGTGTEGVYVPPAQHWQALGTGVLLFGVPALLLGMASPYAAKLYVGQFHQMGGGLGQVYGVSTVGSILGTLGTAFYLTAWIGTDAILRTNGVVLIGLGAALVAADALRRRGQSRSPA